MDSNLLRTKSIEQLVGDAEHGGKALQADADRHGPDAARHRRDHRDGHLRPDRDGRRQPGRPRHRALLRSGRARLRLRGALLRRVRVDDSDLRQRLHLRLRDARRDLRVDDRLGPDPRVRGRIDDRRGRLERLLPADPRRLRHPPAGLDVGGAERRRWARSSTCRPCSSCSRSWCCWSSACARARASTRRWSRSSSPPSLFFIVVGVGYVQAGELVAVHAVRLRRAS